MKMIDIAISGKGFENIQTKLENIELLYTLESYYLIHFTTYIYWGYNICDIVISEIFTDSNGALCIFFIENNAENYAKVHREQKKCKLKGGKIEIY